MKTVFDLATGTLESGVTLIEASAGTGKTFSLAGLILRLVLEEHITINEILAVTYTIAATAELKERVRERLHAALEDLRRGKTEDEVLNRVLKAGDTTRSIQELDLALQSFDEAQVFTIHGFCQRTLQDYAFETGIAFGAELVIDPTPFFEQVARDFWRLKFYAASPLIATLTLAWERSPQEWVELLACTQNHPDLVLIPPATSKSYNELATEVEQSLETICKEWTASGSAVEQILRKDKNLKRSQNAFRSDRVEELLQQVKEVGADFEGADPASFQVIKDLTREAVQSGTLANHRAPSHRFFNLCSVFSAAVEQFFLRLTYDFLQYAEDELPKRKTRTNTVTFDDLIRRLHAALKSASGERLAREVGRKYRAALIDEFQDTDPAQYDIFRRVFGSGKHYLYYIGDPKQAIYGFRGADVFTYLVAASDANRSFTLGSNWRSEKRLVIAVNKFFQQTYHPFVLPRIDYHIIRAASRAEVPLLTKLSKATAAPLRFRLVASTRENGEPMNQTEATAAVCRAVAADVIRLQASGAQLGDQTIGFGDMAILTLTNKQAEEVQEGLREHGVRSIVQSELSVFDSPEATELQWLLQGIIDPGRERLFKAALITSLIGLNGDSLVALETDEAVRQRWLDKFSDWRNHWKNECFIAAFRRILTEQNVRTRLVQLTGGERRLTNFLHLAELLHAAETAERLSLDHLSSWLRRQCQTNRISAEEFQLRLEGDTDAVQIVTIHKCKGLEYPIVFCPFLWTPVESSQRDELKFHDRKNGDRLTLSLRGKSAGTVEQQNWQTEEITSEKVRMVYVAVTRAKNRCTIHVPQYVQIAKSPLAHLFREKQRSNLERALTKLAGQAPDCIAVSAMSKDPTCVAASAVIPPKFSARRFHGAIDSTAMVASFSGLSSGRVELEEREPEISDQPDAIGEGRITYGDTIFDFPRGARAGDFFHGVLERIDFVTPNLEQLVDEQLGWHGFANTKCREAILSNLRGLLQVELVPGMSLKTVGKKSRLSELEFTYRLNRLDPGRLCDIFERCSGLPASFKETLGRLRFDPVEGYLRGFIDLFFEFEHRYFILDWKSNWLGNRPSDYGESEIRDSMAEHNYFLQAHLYVLAADLFLGSRLKEYDYARDFGGVFYVFLRGVDPLNPSLGILRQRPTVETILALRELAA